MNRGPFEATRGHVRRRQNLREMIGIVPNVEQQGA